MDKNRRQEMTLTQGEKEALDRYLTREEAWDGLDHDYDFCLNCGLKMDPGEQQDFCSVECETEFNNDFEPTNFDGDLI